MPTASKNRKKPAAPVLTKRPVLYPEVIVAQLRGDDALTADKAKDMLGWEEVPAWDDSCSPEIRTLTGMNVRLANNLINRPIDVAWIRVLIQEILNRRWRFNGYTIVIGTTGQVLSAQHRLIAVVVAEWERTNVAPVAGTTKAAHWEERGWTGPVTIETLVCYGVEESDDVFQTLNRERQGTGSDVLYRSPHLSDLKPADRKACARVTDYAVKLLWHRVGQDVDAFARYRTPAETMDFINRHERVVKAARHVYEEDSEGKVGKYVSPGTAAGLMYLEGTSTSDGERYRSAEVRDESTLDFRSWDKAEEFWVVLASGGDELKELRNVLGMLGAPDSGTLDNRDARVGTLVKAWQEFSSGRKVLKGNLSLAYRMNGDTLKLIECPTVGGIDLGNPKEEPEPEPEVDPTPEEIEQRSREERARRESDKVKAKDSAAAPGVLDRIKEAHPGKLLLFLLPKKGPVGEMYRAWGGDASAVAGVLDAKVMKNEANGLNYCTFAASESKRVVDLLVADGREVAFVRGTMEAPEVVYHEPTTAEPEKPKATSKKPAVTNGKKPKGKGYADFKAKQLKDLENVK